MDNNEITKCAAIVIVAFNRASSLARLLSSIAGAEYPGFINIPLVISIDDGGLSEVNAIADRFNWQHGNKRIIKHSKKLGLRNHVLFCGDLSLEYGAVIVLEDDLFVSPYFYQYVASSISFFSAHKKICQISLYSPQMNEFARRPFTPLVDGFDNYFIQSASSWGQVWTAEYWQGFRKWYAQCLQNEAEDWDGIPFMVKEWPATSWKKYFIKYMHDCNMHAVYPRVSLTTNFGDDGVHMKSVGSRFQVPLLLAKKTYSFGNMEKSIATYDAFFEPSERMIKKIVPCLAEFESIEADFYGIKRQKDISADFLISVKHCIHPIFSFGGQMQPPINNTVFEIPGRIFSIGKVSNFKNIPIYLRLRIFREMLAWVGYSGLINGVKSRIKKYFKF